jgi:hypothetical protein
MPTSKLNEITNPQLVTIAVYLLGGDTNSIDTEDAAYKANQLAPGRFAWRKYPDQINLELIRVYLSDAKKTSHGEYLRGSGSDGWMLTQRGLEFSLQSIDTFDERLRARTPKSPSERKQFASERRRLLESDAYEKFRSGHIDDVSRRDVENFFRVDDYVVGKAREKKIARLIMMFSADDELSDTVRALAQVLTKPGEKCGDGTSNS